MYNIKHLDITHIDQLAGLHKDAFATGWEASEFQTHIENEYDDVIGALHGDQIAGFAVIRTQVDQSEILTIIVKLTQRGKGLGAELLKTAERRAAARQADIMFLEVAADNPSAQALYSNNGYQRCGTRKGYYRREKGRVDALLFQKRL